ncbi:MAG: hypothetical protein R3E84_09635 [Pseudomonadales bacterium]
MPNILAQIRSAFGKDAIILDKQRVNGRLVVMACGEQDLAMDAQGMELVLGPVPEAGRDRCSLRTSKWTPRGEGRRLFRPARCRRGDPRKRSVSARR